MIWYHLLLILAFLCQGIAWDYSSNGANWDALGQCGAGGPQSPINLPAVAAVDEEQKIFLKYPKVTSPFQLYHNGNSIAFTLPDSYKGGFGLGEELGGLGAEDASAYRLWQVNFHSPSEHTLKGERFPLEMQLMHQRVTGGSPETAVIVVLFQSAANSYIDFLDKLTAEGVPKKPWDETTVPKGAEMADIIGGSPFYKYGGSLTQPPCERQVKYFVRQEPIPTAMAQLRKFSKVLKETCAPNGNFRALKPLNGDLHLMTSVDVVRDLTVKPKVSELEAKASVGEPGATAPVFHCPAEFIDHKWKNIGRIEVEDTPEIIKAKTDYNRDKREQQVAEGGLGNAVRAYKFQKTLYDNSPGFAEKINNKWALVGAESVLAGAKKNLAGYAGAAGRRQAAMQEAIIEACKKKYQKKEEKKEEEAPKEVKKKAPPEDIPKPDYPEPHVKLPQGLGASPFGTGDSEGGGAAKISANLHQEDLPPSSSVDEAEAAKEVKPEPKESNPEVIIEMELPVAPAAIADKAAFKKELAEALAESAEVAPHRLTVKEFKGKAVAKVHASMSLAQKSLRGR